MIISLMMVKFSNRTSSSEVGITKTGKDFAFFQKYV